MSLPHGPPRGELLQAGFVMDLAERGGGFRGGGGGREEFRERRFDRFEGFGWDDYWDYYYPYPAVEFVTEAHVALHAFMVRLSDGQVLHSTAVPVEGNAAISGYVPRPPRDAMILAIDQACRQLVAQFAIVPTPIKVNPGRDLRTATGRQDGQWVYSDRFHAADKELYVVLRLPKAADNNSFRLTITPKGQPLVVAEQEFTWSAKDSWRGFAFPMDKIVADTGAGWYSVNFHSGGELVMSHGLLIR
jgi:hypothetical protein